MTPYFRGILCFRTGTVTSDVGTLSIVVKFLLDTVCSLCFGMLFMFELRDALETLYCFFGDGDTSTVYCPIFPLVCMHSLLSECLTWMFFMASFWTCGWIPESMLLSLDPTLYRIKLCVDTKFESFLYGLSFVSLVFGLAGHLLDVCFALCNSD